MKFKFIMFFAVVIFASAGAISAAQAQTDEIEKANVPFDFYAGGQRMPAGNYIVGVDLAAQMITLSDDSGENKMFIMGIHAGDGDDKSELVFKHSGNTYALEEVKSDVIDLTFHTTVPELAMESRTKLPPVEVALNR
jgi:hypothetical protein